ncbi:hypothetical protein RB195_018499 [Necator americanus]|uniref:Uncharacterized protein n=1 Tax=Necator americanus TaxID=51031 RepID=A0ABR1CCY1_NECAM
MNSIGEEHYRLVEHLYDCTRKAHSYKTTKRRLSLKIVELIRQRETARAAGNQELKPGIAWLCGEAIKEDLKERRAEVLAEAAEEHSLRQSRIRQSKDEDESSPEPEWNRHSIEKRNGENHSRLLL